MTSQRRADARSLDHISWEFAVAEAVGGAPQLLALLLSTFPAVFEGTSRRTISALTALVHP